MVESALQKMRREGRAYLRKKPGAFGGGIDPDTGIRRKAGRRVSVGTPEEIKAGVEVPTLAEARAISSPTPMTPPSRIVKKSSPLSTPSLTITTTERSITGRRLSQVQSSKGREDAERKRILLEGEVQPIQASKGFIARRIRELEALQNMKSTKSIREKQKELKNELALIGLTMGTTVVGGVQGLIGLPKSLLAIARDPSKLRKVPSVIKTSSREFVQLIRISPTEAFAKIAGEIVLMKGTGTAARIVGKVAGSAATKLNPKFKNIEKQEISFRVSPHKPTPKPTPKPTIKPGKITGRATTTKPTTTKKPTTTPTKTTQPKRVKAVKVKRVGTIKAKPVKIYPVGRKIRGQQIRTRQPKKREVTIRFLKTTKRESLKQQVRIAGTRVTAVSAQADRLVTFIRNSKIVRKPIPGEDDFSPATKKLLKRFDDKTITKKELIQLEKEVQVLERSFFADPRGKVRTKRLGAEQKEASLLDILSGDVTFKSSKPQILVFEDVRVAKFPEKLKDVEKALKTGKTLTKSQSKRLLTFQMKKTGEFKPIGALSKESEITLAPGEIIKRVKKVGVTLVNGKKVEIIQAKIIKPTAPTKKLIAKAKQGKLTSKELKTLRKKLEKETGFKARIGRRIGRRPRARLPKRVPRRPPTRPPRRPPRRAPKRVSRKGRVPRRAPKRVSRRARPPTRPPRRATKRPPRLIPVVPLRAVGRRGKKRKPITRKPKRIQAYNVYARPTKKRKGQRRPKLVKVNKVPLRKSRAKDLRNYVTDTSLSRTARIRKTKGKPKTSKLKIPSGYSQRTSKKFRRYKTVKGKRKLLPKGKVIEKTKGLLDTRGEKNQITLRRRIKQITKPKKKKKR